MNFSLRAPTLAAALHAELDDLPLVSPHGHVPVKTLVDGDLGDPADLFVTGDHYVLRMLHSAGFSLDELGLVRRGSGNIRPSGRSVWRIFCENFSLFRGTPSRFWILRSLESVFGIDERPKAGNADTLYDRILEGLSAPTCAARSLLDRQNVRILSTTDDAGASLEAHKQLRGQRGVSIIPTFRPDSVLDVSSTAWASEIARLSAESQVDITDYWSYISALEARRRQFQAAGGTATDHGVELPYTEALDAGAAAGIFSRAMKGTPDLADARRFQGHMLIEMMRMSADDGLVMQIHAGCYRDHDGAVADQFGPGVGGDIPLRSDWVGGLRPLLERYGNAFQARLVLFTMDESTYARELAPLAGHYPSLRIGPPWWFHDSPNGIRRYLDSVVETAGFSNLAGFNDDGRNVATIGARHELWRRSVCGWLADQVAAGLLDEEESREIARELALDLAVDTYRLPSVSNG